MKVIFWLYPVSQSVLTALYEINANYRHRYDVCRGNAQHHLTGHETWTLSMIGNLFWETIGNDVMVIYRFTYRLLWTGMYVDVVVTAVFYVCRVRFRTVYVFAPPFGVGSFPVKMHTQI